MQSAGQEQGHVAERVPDGEGFDMGGAMIVTHFITSLVILYIMRVFRTAFLDSDRIILSMSVFPQIFRVRQVFVRPRVEDVAAEVHAQLARLELHRRIQPRQTVAVTAGSRGIANIAAILRAAVEHFRGLGAEPFIVPAMGSHGGGTAEGQQLVLESYGITEESVGCPIRSSMETTVVGHAAEGFPLHVDRAACQADHVLVCGRVKPHTSLAGDFQSGLVKMLLIGLGKEAGANLYHRAIEDFGFDRIVRSAAAEVLEKCRIAAGLAIVENAYDETALIEAVEPSQFLVREPQLLALARQWMARLPFDAADVLVIDRIGKNISGVGFDPNVVGRKFNDHQAIVGETPRVKRICIRSLTPESHGNAIGLGVAEFCRTQLLRSMDPRATRLNSLTSGHVAAGMTPLDYETDRDMLHAALGTVGLVEPRHARLLWIADTLNLAEMECSAAYLEEARGRSDLEIVCGLREMEFDKVGNLGEVER
jgi:Lactate racemase N-terminal domain